MKIPPWPQLRPLTQVTPTLYNAALACPAKALWIAHGDRHSFPRGAGAILGAAFHAVSEAAARGGLPGGRDDRSEAAWRLFEEESLRAHRQAHPLVQWRYPTPQHLPYYSLLQAQAAENVRLTGPQPACGQRSVKAECKLTSRDGSVAGRIDLIDISGQSVVDYKSGFAFANDHGAVQEHEARQLRLYAFLCEENGLTIRRGVIVRQGGQRDELSISPDDAKGEADAARETFRRINSAIASAQSAEEIATPSARNCLFCPCRPSCEPFWRDARPDWADEMPPCAEGRLTKVEHLAGNGGKLLILRLEVHKGAAPTGAATTDALPAILAEADGSPSPESGQTIRVLDAAIDSASATLRMRRNGLTTLWTVRAAPAPT